MVGYCSERWQRLLPRPVFYCIGIAGMVLVHLALAVGSAAALYPCSVVLGLCYGSLWVSMPAATSDIFGQVRRELGFVSVFDIIHPPLSLPDPATLRCHLQLYELCHGAGRLPP